VNRAWIPITRLFPAQPGLGTCSDKPARQVKEEVGICVSCLKQNIHVWKRYLPNSRFHSGRPKRLRRFLPWERRSDVSLCTIHDVVDHGRDSFCSRQPRHSRLKANIQAQLWKKQSAERLPLELRSNASSYYIIT
jgi:hypothetical protein